VPIFFGLTASYLASRRINFSSRSKRPRQKLYIQRILSLSLQFHLRRNSGFFSGTLKRTIANSLIELIQPDPAAVGHRQIKMAVIVEITSAEAHNYN
jgi:hypothetical protein